jgi:hypothetical protein
MGWVVPGASTVVEAKLDGEAAQITPLHPNKGEDFEFRVTHTHWPVSFKMRRLPLPLQIPRRVSFLAPGPRHCGSQLTLVARPILHQTITTTAPRPVTVLQQRPWTPEPVSFSLPFLFRVSIDYIPRISRS